MSLSSPPPSPEYRPPIASFVDRLIFDNDAEEEEAINRRRIVVQRQNNLAERRAMLTPLIEKLMRIAHVDPFARAITALFNRSLEDASSSVRVTETEAESLFQLITDWYAIPTMQNRPPKMTQDQVRCIQHCFGIVVIDNNMAG